MKWKNLRETFSISYDALFLERLVHNYFGKYYTSHLCWIVLSKLSNKCHEYKLPTYVGQLNNYAPFHPDLQNKTEYICLALVSFISNVNS